MGDSSSFASLFALVDNHLSKSNIKNDSSQPSTSGLGTLRLPPFNVQKGMSDTGIPSTSMRFPIPSLSRTEHPVNDMLSRKLRNMHTSPHEPPDDDDDDDSSDESSDAPPPRLVDRSINDVLAIQLNNMFKAREAKEQEERKRQIELQQIEERLRRQKLEESSCLIDLMPAVQVPGMPRPEDVQIPSSSSSMESLVMPDAPEMLESEPLQTQQHLQAQPLLGGIPVFDLPPMTKFEPKPINTDMSYILKHKIGKCSQFGKVLCARYKPVAAPYFRMYVPHKIKVFDFSTPSPDDIALERLRKPSYYNNSNNALSVYE